MPKLLVKNLLELQEVKKNYFVFKKSKNLISHLQYTYLFVLNFKKPFIKFLYYFYLGLLKEYTNYIGYFENNCIGCFSLYINKNNEIYLYDFSINNKWRKKRLSSNYLYSICLLVKSLGYTNLFLFVSETNKIAYNLYLKNGFTDISVNKK